jgi:hypothetical protein
MLTYAWLVIVLLLMILMGYAAGRRQGIQAGRRIGKAEANIVLREESIRSGHCKTCDRIYE